MINFDNYRPWFEADLDLNSEREVLSTIALSTGGPIRDLVRYSCHLDEVHEGLHIAASLFGVEPDPNACETVGRRQDWIENLIVRVLDSHKN